MSKAIRGDLTQARLKELFSYDRKTGLFTRRVSRRGRDSQAGMVAGRGTANSYGSICVDRVDYQTHNLAWLYATGKWPEGKIDHRNEDKGDNRFKNLRDATHQQNCFNRGANANNTSGYKGVNWDKQTGKWRAKIMLDGKTKSLGRFDDAKEASQAYKAAAEELHGEYANG